MKSEPKRANIIKSIFPYISKLLTRSFLSRSGVGEAPQEINPGVWGIGVNLSYI